jgi:DNA-3-methyladenine glycosylase
MRALAADFYERPVLEVACALIGCTVVHGQTAGVIVETEAYHYSEPACHAFIGVTQRTQTLFGPPGRAYVYTSYGIHALLNAVCEPPGSAAAVLIRALAPTGGLALMRRRRVGRRPLGDAELCSGPGKLTKALGVGMECNGSSLTDGPVRIVPRPPSFCDRDIVISPRVGISKATELPWRFSVAQDPHGSHPRPGASDRAASA